MLLRSQRSWSFSDKQRETARSLRQRMLGSMALEVAPAIFDATSTSEPIVWLLAGDHEATERFAVDSDGVNAAVALAASQHSGIRGARDSVSARKPDLCGAFSKKFGTLDPQLVPSACGVDTVSNGRRNVAVIWGFANATR